MKKKILNILSILVVSMLIVTNNVFALEITKLGDDIVQEGDYNSLRFVAGNTVTNKASIDGLSLVAANNIIANGHVSYGFYAGNTLSIDEIIDKDMFIAGNVIAIGEAAIISRDAYIAGNHITINANIGRDLRIAASSVDISNITINGDAYITAKEIIMNKSTVITGKLTYRENTQVSGLDVASIGTIKTTKINEDSSDIEINPVNIMYNFVIGVVSAFIIISTLFHLIPQTKEKLNNVILTFDEILKNIGIGLLVLITGPIIIFIGLITQILTPLSLIAIAIYTISIYLSTLLSGYIIGNLINTKLLKNDNVYLSLLLGITLIKLLEYVPILNSFTLILSVFYGLGLIYKYITSHNK